MSRRPTSTKRTDTLFADTTLFRSSPPLPAVRGGRARLAAALERGFRRRGARMSSLDLAIVGNCTFGALIDAKASIVWCCLPRFDSDPVFCCLLDRSEEHTSELQSLMRISYAVFCLKKKTYFR